MQMLHIDGRILQLKQLLTAVIAQGKQAEALVDTGDLFKNLQELWENLLLSSMNSLQEEPPRMMSSLLTILSSLLSH